MIPFAMAGLFSSTLDRPGEEYRLSRELSKPSTAMSSGIFSPQSFTAVMARQARLSFRPTMPSTCRPALSLTFSA